MLFKLGAELLPQFIVGSHFCETITMYSYINVHAYKIYCSYTEREYIHSILVEIFKSDSKEVSLLGVNFTYLVLFSPMKECS